MEAALAGVRVIDASELLPGPYAALVLRDLGADVTKVERPPSGDSARTIAPGMFSVVNEGKDSIQIDLKSAEGAAAFAALVNEADILITGYRPGVARRLNVDYDTLRPRYPRLIYAALSGFGQSGALADVPGHDINFLSAAGVLSLTPDHPINTATGSGLPIGDLCGAMFAVTAILAALRQRERSGEGQFLDVSITACLRHWIAPRLGTMLHAGEDRWTPLPGYGPFTCGDGRRVALAAMEDHFWRDLVELLDCDALRAPEYARYQARREAARTINEHIAAALKAQPADHWLEVMQRSDLPVTADVQAVRDGKAAAIERDPLDLAGGSVRSSFPVPMKGFPARAREAAE